MPCIELQMVVSLHARGGGTAFTRDFSFLSSTEEVMTEKMLDTRH